MQAAREDVAGGQRDAVGGCRGRLHPGAFATLDAPLPNIQQLPLAIIAVRKLDSSQLDSHE